MFLKDAERHCKDSRILLASPLTGHQFHIHSPCKRHCRFILAVPPCDQQFVIAFSAIFPYLQSIDMEEIMTVTGLSLTMLLRGTCSPGCLFQDSLNLVASDEQYFFLVQLQSSKLRVYVLDVLRMECVKVNSLGNQEATRPKE